MPTPSITRRVQTTSTPTPTKAARLTSRPVTPLTTHLKFTSQEDRRKHICYYLRGCLAPNGKKLNKGALEEAGAVCGCSREYVRRVYYKYRNSILNPEQYPLDVCCRAGSGRQRKLSVAELIERVQAVPF